MKQWIVVLMWFAFGALATVPAHAQTAKVQPTMTELWDGIARQHVRPGRIGDVSLNVVDYAAIAADPRWPTLLNLVAQASEPTEHAERLAFWINAYNIMAIEVVLGKYPVKSIKDVGGWFTQVWDIEAGVVGGKMRTLNEIEHEILRKMEEPRIHAAIVCASVSCPPIRAEAFVVGRLDEQLDDQMRVWLANDKVGLSIENDGATLRVSSIFKWFAEDFEKKDGSVRKFVEKYMTDDQRSALRPTANIAYMSYDWSLNDAKRSPAATK